MKVLSALLAAITAFFGMIGAWWDAVRNQYAFEVNTAVLGEALTNTASCLTVWDISGNPFVGVRRNEQNDIFDFVNYVELMQCTGGNAARDLFRDPLDNTVLDDYDFTRLIQNCRGILELGAKPYLKLGSVPLKYTSGATDNTTFETNVYPPDDYQVYYNYMAAIARALVQEFGRDEVASWRFSVMTEFENSDWFMAGSGDPEETKIAYLKLYDYTVQALIDEIGADVFVGAHAMAVTEGLWDETELLRHCANGTNYATGKKGSLIRFMTASFYDARPGQYTAGKPLPKTIGDLRKAAEKAGLHDLLFGVDEGRILSGNTAGQDSDALAIRVCGYTYQAAYDARLVKQMADSGTDYFSAWGYLSDNHFSGAPSVSYHVAANASQFAGMRRAEVKSTKKGTIPKAEVEALSGYDAATGTLRVMAYNFKNKVDYDRSADIRVAVKAPQYNGKKVKITARVIDDDCNYFDEWIQDRETYGIGDDCFCWSPDDPSIGSTTTLRASWARDLYYNTLREKYMACAVSEPVSYETAVTDGILNLRTKLAPNGVVFWEITEVK